MFRASGKEFRWKCCLNEDTLDWDHGDKEGKGNDEEKEKEERKRQERRERGQERGRSKEREAKHRNLGSSSPRQTQGLAVSPEAHFAKSQGGTKGQESQSPDRKGRAKAGERRETYKNRTNQR